MSEFEEYITDLGLVEFAGWHFDKDECDEYLHEPTNAAHNIWRDKEHTVRNQQAKIDELQNRIECTLSQIDSGSFVVNRLRESLRGKPNE